MQPGRTNTILYTYKDLIYIHALSLFKILICINVAGTGTSSIFVIIGCGYTVENVTIYLTQLAAINAFTRYYKAIIKTTRIYEIGTIFNITDASSIVIKVIIVNITDAIIIVTIIITTTTIIITIITTKTIITIVAMLIVAAADFLNIPITE